MELLTAFEGLSRKKFFLVSFLILFFWGFFIYSNSFSGELVLDDANVVKPELLDIWENPANHFYFGNARLIADISFALNYKLHGESVWGYHLVNWLIHLTNSILVLVISYKLLKFTSSHQPSFATSYAKTRKVKKASDGRPINSYTNTLALTSSLIFLSHPIQTMAVSYITQRYESLATMFYLLAVAIFLHFRKKTLNFGFRISNLHALVCFGFIFLLFILGFHTKVIIATLPLMLLVIEWIVFRKGKVPWKLILGLFPVIGMIFLFAGYMYTFNFLFATFENTHGEMVSPFWYALTQFRVFMLYLFQIMLPIRLNADHHMFLSTTIFDIRIWIGIGLWISCWGLVWINRLKNPLISLGLAWFLITPLPSSSIIPILDVANEYRMYLPMAGVSFILVGACNWILKKYKNVSNFLFLISYFLIFILGLLTFNRNFTYQTAEAFWKDVVQKSPGKARGYVNLGTEYHKQGKIDLAKPMYESALEIDPDRETALANLGAIYVQKRDYDTAIVYFNQALAVDPNYKDALNGLGVIYLNTGDLDKAEELFTKVVKLDPSFTTGQENLELVRGMDKQQDTRNKEQVIK